MMHWYVHYVYVSIYLFVYLFIYLYVCIYIYIVCVYMYMYMYIYIYMLCVYICIHTQIYIYICFFVLLPSPLPIHCTGHAVLESSDIASITSSAQRPWRASYRLIRENVWRSKGCHRQLQEFLIQSSFNASRGQIPDQQLGPKPLATLFSTSEDSTHLVPRS